MDIVFKVIDKSGRKIHLSKERWKHILKHPFMHDQIGNIQVALKNPAIARYFEDDEKVRYF